MAAAAARGGEPFTSRSSDVARPAPGSHDHVLGLLSPGTGRQHDRDAGNASAPPINFFQPALFQIVLLKPEWLSPSAHDHRYQPALCYITL